MIRRSIITSFWFTINAGDRDRRETRTAFVGTAVLFLFTFCLSTTNIFIIIFWRWMLTSLCHNIFHWRQYFIIANFTNVTLEFIFGLLELLWFLVCDIRVTLQDFSPTGYLWFVCWNIEGSLFAHSWSVDIGWRITIVKTPIEVVFIYVTDWKKRKRKVYFINLLVLVQPASLLLWKYCSSLLPIGFCVQNNAKFFEDPTNFSLEYEARKARFPEYDPEGMIIKNEGKVLTEEQKKSNAELDEKFRIAQEEFYKRALAEKQWDEDLLDLSMSFFMALTVVMYISYFRSEAMGRSGTSVYPGQL